MGGEKSFFVFAKNKVQQFVGTASSEGTVK